jgi:hypothetical protein
MGLRRVIGQLPLQKERDPEGPPKVSPGSWRGPASRRRYWSRRRFGYQSPSLDRPSGSARRRSPVDRQWPVRGSPAALLLGLLLLFLLLRRGAPESKGWCLGRGREVQEGQSDQSRRPELVHCEPR